MGQINSLYESLGRKFGEQVQVAAYNINYDDLDEVRPFIDRIYKESIKLPATFIGDGLAVEGRIDESVVSRAIKDLGAGETLANN